MNCRFRVLGHVLALAGLMVCSSATADDSVRVPGGTAAVARLLGNVDTQPERFCASLNRVLLSQIVIDHDWESHDNRLLLAEYAGVVGSLGTADEVRVVFEGKDKSGRKQFKKFTRTFGYDTKRRKGRLELIPRDSDEDKRRRRVAMALEWDLVGGAKRLSDGEQLVFSATSETVPAALGLRDGGSFFGSSVRPENALEKLAMDQRLGLVVEGLRRTNTETRQLLQKELLRFLYDEVPVAFYRYASAIEIIDGRLTLPGGPGALQTWSELLDVSPERPIPFIKALLEDSDGRAAYLWHALFFAPPDVSALIMDRNSATDKSDRRFVRRFFRKLKSSKNVVRYDMARGRDLGFAALVRSIDRPEAGSGLEFPGGARLWWDTVRGDDPIRSGADAAKIVVKAGKNELSTDDFILKVLTETSDVGEVERLVLPRVIRLFGAFRGRPELFSPNAVVLLGRAGDWFPSALPVLDRMRLNSPKAMERYLVTVAGLGSLPKSSETFALVDSFQGGVELVRMLDQAEFLGAEQTQTLFMDWLKVHQSARLAWLSKTVRMLPQVPEDSPGRGPLERALVAALVSRRDPQTFTWRGLEYQGRRGLDLARRMVVNLETQGIPPVDLIVQIADDLDGLEAALNAADLEQTRELVSSLMANVRALPTPAFDPPLDDNHLEKLFLPVQRPSMLKDLGKVGKIKKAKKLPKRAPDIADFRADMDRELRPLLLAPVYIEAMGEGTSVLLEDSNLVRKHSAVRYLDKDLPGDTPWAATILIPSSESTFGTHVAGHVSGVAAALVRFRISGLDRGELSRVQNVLRDQLWFEDLATTRWQTISPELSRFSNAAIAVGGAALNASVGGEGGVDGEALALCRAKIPSARLEAELHRRRRADQGGPAVVGPSELFMIGLEITERGFPGANHTDDLESAVRDLEKAREGLGRGWRKQINVLGAPTITINGIGRPWVGDWPPYEALESEGPLALLNERQLVDLRLKIFNYLGEHGLPGEVGRDLMEGFVMDAASTLRIETLRDWEGFLAWIGAIDEDALDERMRQCFATNLYSAQLF